MFVSAFKNTCKNQVDITYIGLAPGVSQIVTAVSGESGMCEMDRLLAIGEKYGIPIIEDAAEAIGSIYHGKRALPQ